MPCFDNLIRRSQLSLNPIAVSLSFGKSTDVLDRCIRPCRRSVKVLTCDGAEQLQFSSITRRITHQIDKTKENRTCSRLDHLCLSVQRLVLTPQCFQELVSQRLQSVWNPPCLLRAASFRIQRAGSEYKLGLEEMRLGTDFQYLSSMHSRSNNQLMRSPRYLNRAIKSNCSFHRGRFTAWTQWSVIHVFSLLAWV